MEALKIVEYPHSILRQRCAPVERIASFEKDLFESMLATMRHYGGIGLAAPQVGVSKNLIVADTGGNALKLANPVIVKVNGAQQMEEGCLSIPGIEVAISRPYEVIVRGLNEKGEIYELKTQGLLARVLQHEIDHLRGRLIVDYLNLLEKFKLKLHTKGRTDARSMQTTERKNL